MNNDFGINPGIENTQDEVARFSLETESEFYASIFNNLKNNAKPHLFSFNELGDCNALIQNALARIHSLSNSDQISEKQISAMLVEPAIRAFTRALNESCHKDDCTVLIADALRIDLLEIALSISVNAKHQKMMSMPHDDERQQYADSAICDFRSNIGEIISNN